MLPAMTYGAETWTLTKQAQNKLAAAQTKMERSMLNITYKDRKTSICARERTKVIEIISNVRKMKWSWAGHINCLKDDRWTSIVNSDFRNLFYRENPTPLIIPIVPGTCRPTRGSGSGRCSPSGTPRPLGRTSPGGARDWRASPSPPGWATRWCDGPSGWPGWRISPVVMDGDNVLSVSEEKDQWWQSRHW